MRLRIDLAYDGTAFRGWATQPGLRTVQQTVEEALAMVLRTDRVPVVCAGRTDAGVHARGQVIHLDVDREMLIASATRTADPPLVALVRRLNGLLPADIRIRQAAEAAPGFDARFSALWRRYAYRVADVSVAPDPLRRDHVLTWGYPLDLAAMNEAAKQLLGEHDFASFCRRRPGATTIRTLLDLSWAREPDGLAVATVRADAFCHSMVRAMVGCLLAVGDGRQPGDWAGAMLRSRERHPANTVAHAHGLTLEQVCYPHDDQLGSRADLTRARRE